MDKHLNKVEGLRLVLLSRRYRAQHLVDIRHPPHCGAQEGRSGAHTGPQHVQQVPDTTLVELQGKRNVHSLTTCNNTQLVDM